MPQKNKRNNSAKIKKQKKIINIPNQEIKNKSYPKMGIRKNRYLY